MADFIADWMPGELRPSGGQKVLASIDSAFVVGHPSVQVAFYDSTDDTYMWDDYKIEAERVLAWMDCPEPPEMEE